MTATVASAIPTAPPTATTGVPNARRMPPNAGPTSSPIPSPVLDATLDATSSSAERARPGMIAFWSGRIAAVAIALTAAMAMIASRPASIARATAATTALARAVR